MNSSLLSHRLLAAVTVLLCASVAGAQFSQLITGFEQDSRGAVYPFQFGSLNDLQVVFLQDPAEADVTATAMLSDAAATVVSNPGLGVLPSSEESFVAKFTGDFFFGANGTDQFLDVRFEWANSSDPNRWVLVETLQSPTLGDPSLDLGGKVRFYVNIPDCSAFEFPGLIRTPEIGVALLVSETGIDLPQGFQDGEVLNGSFEFVGVSSVIDPNTPNPIPVPTTFIPITDADCSGSSTGPAGDWRLVTIDLATAGVAGWTYRGGDGTLDATGVGDGVNRGVLAGIALTVRNTDITSQYVEFLIDNITFEATATEPAVPPTIVGPVIANDISVLIDNITPRATLVTLEVDRDPNDDPNVFTVSDSVPLAPGLSVTGELRSKSIPVAALGIGDRLRAKQQVGGDIGDYSLIVTVNPPAAFSATLSLDEDGNSGTADYEWVGATSVVGQSGTQGKPIIPQNGVWQRLEFSLIPGVEPVISFAGGNGQLLPDGGLYKLDSMFFTIDSTAPSTGPYNIFIDHIYYVDSNGDEVLIADSESANPFPNVRGQSTSTNTTSIISGLASYDGSRSNRMGWEFPNTDGSNTHAPYRPDATFADSAQAVGMFLLVEDPRDPNLPTPTVETLIIGAPPAINVSDIDPTATQVDLLVNGAVVNSVDPNGAVALDVDPVVALALGDSISAQMTVGGTPSNFAFARAVQAPGPPITQGPLVENQTSVTVNGILNTGNAVANLVTLFSGATPIVAPVDPAGQASVTFTVPGLGVGEQISATQTVNGIESVNSAPVGVGTGETICVFINEFQYDDSGTDDREFVEIYNGEPNAVDISGWTLRASDTVAPPLDNNPDYTIPAATILAPGDYYVVGAATVANVDLVVGTINLWENDNEALELLNENGVVVDTLVYELNKGPVAVSPAEGGFWGNFASIDGTVQSLSRWWDGYDTDDNGRDFAVLPATPGASNSIASIDPLTENFDGSAGSNVPNFTGSFVVPKHIDPTVADAYNPSVIPASPQGGNAGICWDPTGGGNQGALNDEARYNVAFSCEVYLDASATSFDPNSQTGEYQLWSIGLGAVGSYHNSFEFNGNTGLMWEYRLQESGDPNLGGTIGTLTLQLVDRNDGGGWLDSTVLLDVPTVAITTGWHTISLTRNYESYDASFDGVINASGVVPANGPSALQMGYREFIVTNSLARPLTFDALSVTEPAAPALGACCVDCGCDLMTEATCLAIGGVYAGDGTDCTDVDMNGIADACEGGGGCPNPGVSGTFCTADIDGSGDCLVQLNDLARLLSSYGVDAGGDIDGDLDTDLADLAALLAQYGDDCN